MRNLLSLFDLSSEDLSQILAHAIRLKAEWNEGHRQKDLPGYVLGMLFEKPSLRTRVSFEAAMTHLGGSTIFLGSDAGWGKREPTSDFGRVLSSYLDVLVFRGKDDEVLRELAEASSCPVINGLTPDAHPCQAIADLLTIRELAGENTNCKLAYVGDGNNVARSLAVACALADIRFSCASPIGYLIGDAFLERLEEHTPGAPIDLSNDPALAVHEADFVYTDVWVSMGQESDRHQKLQDFEGFSVTPELMSLANPHARFLHCLPAVRGEEVAAEVIDGPQSAIVLQAENRMHAQKAILYWLLKGEAASTPEADNIASRSIP